jgi:hypothetical protein
MREFWALVMICAAVFSAFATSMLVVIAQTGQYREVGGMTVLAVVVGWTVVYFAYKSLKAIPKKKEDIW